MKKESRDFIDNAKLLPCPFCGGTPGIRVFCRQLKPGAAPTEFVSIFCEKCLVETRGRTSVQALYAQWNRRFEYRPAEDEKEEYEKIKEEILKEEKGVGKRKTKIRK